MKELLGQEGLKRHCRGYTDETVMSALESLAHKAEPCLRAEEHGWVKGGEPTTVEYSFLKLCLLFVRGDGFCA